MHSSASNDRSAVSQQQRAAAATPSYARPNIASRLPNYANQSAETIHAAFVPGSFTTIGRIPAGHVTMPNGDVVPISTPFRASGAAGSGAFSEFNYVCSPLDLTADHKSATRKAHEERMREIGGSQPFFSGYSAVKPKYDDSVYEFVPDPYDAAREKETQERFLSESKALSKPFVPPGRDKVLEKPTRVLLGDMMSSLYKVVLEDWPEAQPTVLSTSEDLIVVYFSTTSGGGVGGGRGVLTYMNNALKRNPAIQQYGLNKVVEGWNVLTDDGHVMYTLRPPWVRPRNFLAGSANSGA